VLNLVFTEKEVPILFSVSKDSTVKAWLFDNEGPQAEFSATQKWFVFCLFLFFVFCVCLII
jgi:hypothetical protein